MPPKQDRHLPKGLFVLHDDRDLLVVEKPAGLLTMGTEREKERTAYFALTDYVRKGNPKSPHRIFIVHRLDRETSGLLLFAKTEQAKFRLQDAWSTVEKKYLAVVHGHCVPLHDTITTLLAENQAFVVYETTDPAKGKPATTEYTVLKTTKHLSLLEIRLLTGRKHQIRVQLAARGFPVVGDKKYGLAGDPNPRLALHAHALTFNHPTTGRPLTFTTDFPKYFEQLVGQISDPTPAPE
jgi:tRNA pseudouridine32 synthase/23S rRNA pseudouridine746 synthase/23S rRNA pseudouridine1911/1915/1917 synthase